MNDYFLTHLRGEWEVTLAESATEPGNWGACDFYCIIAAESGHKALAMAKELYQEKLEVNAELFNEPDSRAERARLIDEWHSVGYIGGLERALTLLTRREGAFAALTRLRQETKARRNRKRLTRKR
jgi:Cdc6-like AAA superfamily ATPase